jgi:AraC family transcriptional regulator, carnitine catabolism transcriptional activator
MNQGDARVSAVLGYLSNQDLQCPPPIILIAGSLNLSLSRLRSIFKKHTGMPLGRYLKYLRLQRAHELLRQTQLTVKEVMVQVGLTDHSHFARDYKKEFGESPSETRCSSDPVKAMRQLSAPQNNQIGHKRRIA